MNARCATRLALALGILLAGSARAGIPPAATNSTAAPQVSFDAATSTYVFTAGAVSYFVPVAHPDVKAGMLRVEASVGGRARVVAVSRGGARYRDATSKILEPEDLAALGKATLTNQALTAGVLQLVYSEQPGAHALSKSYSISLVGAALVIDVSGAATFGTDGWAGLAMGSTDGTPGARVVSVPFLPEPVAVLADGTFLTAYLDRTLSSGASVSARAGTRDAQSVWAHGYSTVQANTAGVAPPLHERGYLVVSDRVQDLFPVVADNPSPYRAALSRRLVLDVWSQHSLFGAPEGVGLGWTTPASAEGQAHLTVAYSRSGIGCGDGVRLIVSKAGALLEQRDLPPGPIPASDYQTDVQLAQGDALEVAVMRLANNSCDGLQLRLTVQTATGGAYDSVTDFSSVDGQRGFTYREIEGDAREPMTYDTATARWLGKGAYSILAAGFAHPGQRPSYGDAESMVERFTEYGLTDLVILFHVWQRHGYDAGLPEHYPANPAGGTGAQMKSFVAAAKAAGMLVALHENYTDMYPDAPPDYPSPLFDAAAIALNQDGTRRRGWFNPGTGQQAFVVANERMLTEAQKQCPLIAGDYAPNATYIDVSTGWDPSRGIDFAGSVPTMQAAYSAVRDFFLGMKGFYQGPLFGEGGEGPGRFDTYFAGAVDAVERQVEGRMRAMVAPDFELSSVRPRQLNHGLGYYSRYFVPEGQGTVTPDMADLDQYRASEIAFGHAGFLGEGIDGLTPRDVLRFHAREYFLMQELQSRYADAALGQVVYLNGTTRSDLSAALSSKLDLSTARVEIDYAGGLTVVVNRDSAQRVYSAAALFSSTQGEGGFGYYEEGAGGTLVPMTWDAAAGRWHGSRTYSLLWAAGGHPDQAAVVRTWTSPVAATVRVQGTAADTDPSCGDGVDVEIRNGAQSLWAKSIDNGGPAQSYDLSVAVKQGDVLWFRIDQRANNLCDGTAFAPTISYRDGADHSWHVVTPAGERVLPPGSFAAWAPDGFLAYSALSSGQRVDYLGSKAYLFADSRGSLATIEELQTDGAVAIVPTAFGDELHAIQATRVARSGKTVLTASIAADVNLRWLDAHRALLVARDTAAGAKVDLVWGALPAGWAQALAAHPDEVEVAPCDLSGNPSGPATGLHAASGSIALSALVPERYFLVHETSACVVDADCTGASCEAGRCVKLADAGRSGVDASQLTDAAPPVDAASAVDSGAALTDAGAASGDAATSSPASSGCGCAAAGEAPILALASTALFFVRRRRS